MKISDGSRFCIPADKRFAVSVLASGSRGNSVFMSDGNTSVLVDAGLSGREIEKRLACLGVTPSSLDAIIISHEHTDHVRGAGVLARRYKLPVWISQATHEAAASCLGELGQSFHFECGKPFCLKIHPFPLSHDACDPAGFTFFANGVKIGLATDLGVPTAVVKTRLRECRILILEANHDPEMLLEGSYPWPVKQRIKGRNGHLSNEDSRTLIAELDHDGLAHVVLAHLSMENNTPEKALSTVGSALRYPGTKLSVAMQDRCGSILYV
ncbi:MAG: MBL fold metallo-hydrolase [Desulfococcus sp. 4484_241]|nr:MAG: MBL fold metallo-hydrolase [Desulfococcus sp. 4484_241]